MLGQADGKIIRNRLSDSEGADKAGQIAGAYRVGDSPAGGTLEAEFDQLDGRWTSAIRHGRRWGRGLFLSVSREREDDGREQGEIERDAHRDRGLLNEDRRGRIGFAAIKVAVGVHDDEMPIFWMEVDRLDVDVCTKDLHGQTGWKAIPEPVSVGDAGFDGRFMNLLEQRGVALLE